MFTGLLIFRQKVKMAKIGGGDSDNFGDTIGHYLYFAIQ